MTSPATSTAPPASFVITKRKVRMLGLTVDDCAKCFFGSNATLSIVVLALITYFLIREGAGFFGQNRENLQVYRQAGLEYVDFIRAQTDDHTALTRYLSDLRLRTFNHYTNEKKLSLDAANAALAPLDEFSGKFSDSIEPIRGLVSELGDVAVAIKTKFIVNEDKKVERAQLLAEGNSEAAAKVEIVPVDFVTELKPILGTLPIYKDANRAFSTQVSALLANLPTLPHADLQQRMERFGELVREFLNTLP